jgi:hypothetical protein
MPKFRSLSLCFFLTVAALLISAVVPLAHGQTLASTASFSGSVSDSSGARVPNANVTLSSPEKGITRIFKTDAEGNFSFALLPAAREIGSDPCRKRKPTLFWRDSPKPSRI